MCFLGEPMGEPRDNTFRATNKKMWETERKVGGTNGGTTGQRFSGDQQENGGN